MKTKSLSKKGQEQVRHRYRSLWISDVHLGTSGCKAEHLVDFLKHHECETLYLVGDIIDGWKLKSTFFWQQEHANVRPSPQSPHQSHATNTSRPPSATVTTAA